MIPDPAFILEKDFGCCLAPRKGVKRTCAVFVNFDDIIFITKLGHMPHIGTIKPN